MATYLDGNVRKATRNTVLAMERSARVRRCPKCGRKSALKYHSDELAYGHYCRWPDCNYEHFIMRDFGC
jgi:hypothetical protein